MCCGDPPPPSSPFPYSSLPLSLPLSPLSPSLPLSLSLSLPLPRYDHMTDVISFSGVTKICHRRDYLRRRSVYCCKGGRSGDILHEGFGPFWPGGPVFH